MMKNPLPVRLQAGPYATHTFPGGDRWRRILDRAHQRARQERQPIMASHTIHVGLLDPIDLFDRARTTARHRWLWCAPGGFSLIGTDAAWSLSPKPEMLSLPQCGQTWQRLLGSAIVHCPSAAWGAGPLLMGGAAFDQDGDTTKQWQGFPKFRFVLPRITYCRTNTEAWLTINAVNRPDHDLATEREHGEQLAGSLMDPELRAAGGRRSNVAAARDSNCETFSGEIGADTDRCEAEWKALVKEAVTQIDRGSLEKVVLARQFQMQSNRTFNVPNTLRRLQTVYKDCYLFAFDHGGRCFLGATPERLVRLNAGKVQAASLAGTIRRGASAAEDARLGQTLLNDIKSRVEHQLVTDMIKNVLSPICRDLQVASGPSLLKLANVQHLYTPITATVKTGQTVLDLVERLHPTPAVGGCPRPAALRFIRQYESWDRGWYAGPVGWVGRESEGEFAVAIRSGVVHGNRAALFAGCGIVSDSDPEHEYQESCLKLKPLITALGWCSNNDF